MAELVTGAQNSVVFWEEKSLTRRRAAEPFPDSDYTVTSLSWSANNTKLAVVPKRGDRVAVCDFRDDILTWSYLVQKDGSMFTCGCLLGSSRYLASGCDDSSVLLWDLKHKNIVKTFQSHSGPVSSVVATGNDQAVVSGGQDGHIFLHPLSGQGKTVQLTHSQSTLQSVSRLSVSLVDQSHLGCVSEGGEVSLWSLDSQRKLTTFSPKHSKGATDLSFTPSNKILMVSVGLDCCIRCYDLQTRKVVATIVAPAPLSSVSILRNGSTLLAGGTDGKLYLYELRSLKSPRSVTDAHQTAVTCITPHTPFKTPARKSSTRDQASSQKDSTHTNLGKSHQASTRPQSKSSSLLPETVTPFVTQQRSSIPLDVNTPYSMMKVGSSGPPTVSVMATPANSNEGDMSSMFSPLDSHHITTPLSSGTKVTATVPPTQRSGPITSISNAVPTSTTLPQAPPPSLPLATPVLPLTTPVLPSTGGSGIFSPFNSRIHGESIGESPTLLDTSSPLMSHGSHMTSLNQPSTVSKDHMRPPPVAVSQVTTATVAVKSQESPVPAPPVRSSQTTVDDRVDSPPAPAPVSGGIQTQYLERIIKDSSEELWYSVHRDTRGLTVDMIRQFLNLQEGLAAQFAALNEKVDRLSEENKKLHELVHQCMPKH